MMLVDMDSDGLVVFPTHRLIHDVADFDEEALIEKCKEYFDVSKETDYALIEEKLDELYKENICAFALYTGKETWTKLTLKNPSIMDEILKEESYSVRHLDVSVLHSLVLERVLGIDKENMANQINLTYTRSFDEAISSVNEKASQAAFILNPTRISEIRDVASEGEKMPQKSTYFYPKLITGLVMNKMNVITE